MNRNELLNKAYQRGELLNLKNSMYKKWIDNFVFDEIKADIGTGDITSESVIKKDENAKAIVATREDGIVAGIEEATYLYGKYGISVVAKKKDGDKIQKRDIIFELTGNAQKLLEVERSAVDLLQRMSGIATLTHELINKVDGKIKIAPTRKTHWRYLDKKAVFVGCGLTHRLALWESILIKDNHLTALKNRGVSDYVNEALNLAWEKKEKANFIEIETFNEWEAISAAKTFKDLQQGKIDCPCIIMLDNIWPKDVKVIIDKLKSQGLYDHVLLEASGGINPDNIIEYSTTGIDVVSIGYLTHSSRIINIGQKFV
jgi:nicotinate-nucleotide pyrophosphorylase (carboxylating)